jgi:uncharacterized membrane protein (Fun14 family)
MQALNGSEQIIENVAAPAVELAPPVDLLSTSGDFIDTQAESLQAESFVERLKENKALIITIAISFGGGVLFGWLLKQYFKYVMIAIAIVIGVLVLSYYGVLTVIVDWDKIHSMMGLNSITPDSSLWATLMQWVKEHVAMSVSFAVGVLVGLRL